MELDEAKKKLADIRVLVSSTGVEIQTKRVEGNDGNKRIKDLEEEIAQTRQTCLFTYREIDDLKRKITAFIYNCIIYCIHHYNCGNSNIFLS